jgi:hypothetical protein
MMGKVLEAAGQPNEYDTSTFVNYDRITKPGGSFDTFFQDPEIQSILHVRGINIPGINFYPENYDMIKNATEYQLFETSHNREKNDFYYHPPNGWSVCNDNIVRDGLSLYFTVVLFLCFIVLFCFLFLFHRKQKCMMIIQSLLFLFYSFYLIFHRIIIYLKILHLLYEFFFIMENLI